MLLVPVVSSDISAMGYDPVGLELQIAFTNGRIYSYQPFPADLYNMFFAASSKGRFFAQFIKKQPSLYPYTRIDGGVNASAAPQGISLQSPDAIPGGSSILQSIEDFEGI